MTLDVAVAGVSTDQAAHVTGLSRRQLSYWHKTGFFSPSIDQSSRAFGRVYTFRDLVGLRTIGVLRNVHKLPLQELRRVGAWLAQHHQTPWASLTLYVSGRVVYFDDPASGELLSTKIRRQSVLPIEMERVATETRREINLLRQRSPSQVGAIAQNRNVVHNEPVLAGTRVPTSAIWNLHVAGYTTSQIIDEYPRLQQKDITAAIEFEHTRRARAAG